MYKTSIEDPGKRHDEPLRIALQMELERLYSKNQLIPRITKEFEENGKFDFTHYMELCSIPVRFGYSILVQMVLHRRTNMATMIGLMRHHFLDEASPSQSCADMLLKAAEHDLVDWDPTAEQFVIRYDITDDVKQELEMFQYPLPMVVRPNLVRNNLDSGYLLNRGSLILKDNHHDDDIVLSHLNLVNSVRYEVNQDTATMVKNKWRNLDRAKEGETQADYRKRVKAFNKYDRTAHDVIKLLTSQGNTFYFTHKYDKRGRTYCMGYHIQYQGNSWNKACIELADKEIVP